VVTVVSRLTCGLRDGWGDAAVRLPPGRWRDILSGEAYVGQPLLRDVLATLPVALLVSQDD
jgi:(1->4)-alpha-D-glucan 1-alpha-D-glucosylmutase